MAGNRGARYEMDMCTGPILGKMLRFALPLMLSSMLQLLFNAADIVVVGRFAGDSALAAVGSTGSLVNLITNVFMGLSVGTNVVVARALGARDHANVQRTVHTSMLVALISGVFLTAVGVIGARRFLQWMGSPHDVIDLAAKYLRIYFVGMTSMMVYNFGSAILRAVGDTRRPLYFLLIAGVLNVVLNLFFVIALHMDVDGVALATIISQTVSAVLVFACLMRSEGSIRFDPRRMRLHFDVFRDIATIGLPAGFQGIMFSISNVAIQSSINAFGSTVVAGSSAAGNIEGFVYVGMNAFYQTAISFIGQNMGAKKYDRIWRLLGTALICVTVVGLVLGVGAWAIGDTLVGIYTSSPDVIAAGVARMKYLSLPYFLCGIMDVLVGALRGIGYSIAPMIVSIVGVCGLRLLWIATVCKLPAFSDPAGLFLSYPVSWVITLTAHFVCFVWAMGRIKKKAALEAAQTGGEE